MMPRFSHYRAASMAVAFASLLGVAVSLPTHQARAQTGLNPSELQPSSQAACAGVSRRIAGSQSGGQWLIGNRIPLYSLSNARDPMTTQRNLFEKVSCYSRIEVGGSDRVFVATPDGSLCGWVEEEDLLDVHRLGDPGSLSGREVCETPRAMTLADFCEVQGVTDRVPGLDCAGVPRGLRTKAVLTGSTGDPPPEFRTAPEGGEVREARPFFSVMEIHDLDVGAAGSLMGLVGDGEGDMFGWLDLQSVQLWPTRVGLFYDENGDGGLFSSQRDLILNARRGEPQPNITPGLSVDELEGFIHGDLPLISYPIVRSVDPALDPTVADGTPPYHEVIFLGQTGDGSASALLEESVFAEAVEQIQRINVMIVMDTTESMRPYLEPVRNGVTEFVRQYRVRRADASNRLPEMRIGVYAYSDFADAATTRLGDTIDIEQLMAPTRINRDFNIEPALSGITSHTGLDDRAGGTGPLGVYAEAAIEAVSTLSQNFERDPTWFENGPRIMIHLADHGSRRDLPISRVVDVLGDRSVYYIPVPVRTDDRGDRQRADARDAFVEQAKALFMQNVADGEDIDTMIPRIDFSDPSDRTARLVAAQLDLAMEEVRQAARYFRTSILGEDLGKDREEARRATEARDLASSRIRIDERILEDRGLDAESARVIVEARSGFAPARLRGKNGEIDIPWTYTVALEPPQVNNLQDKFEALCQLVGRPDKRQSFRDLIVDLVESFSGDAVSTNTEVVTALSDLAEIPGASRSLLSQPAQVLLQRIDSTDPDVVAQLRKDICWISYHMTNVTADLYARPDQLVWTGSSYALAAGEDIQQRTYLYKPIVGAETMYLPSFFFVLPDTIEETTSGSDCFFC